MAYNISKFKVKRLEDFRIPMDDFASLFNNEHVITLENCSEISKSGDVTKITVMYDFFIGTITAGIITFTSLNLRGDFSGIFYDHVLKRMANKTQGTIEVVTIWEGGDHIRRTTIIAGLIKEEVIEL
jgi:hypothetical protein